MNHIKGIFYFYPQILNEDVLKKTCEDSQLCVIAVLPHILDTGESRHNRGVLVRGKIYLFIFISST